MRGWAERHGGERPRAAIERRVGFECPRKTVNEEFRQALKGSTGEIFGTRRRERCMELVDVAGAQLSTFIF